MNPHPYGLWIESQAQALRSLLKLTALAALNPYRLAAAMGVRVITTQEVEEFEHRIGMEEEWSGIAQQLSHGEYLVILNPFQAETRKRATLMEELSHIYLKHPPSQIVVQGGKGKRTYEEGKEKQAFGVGAAALVPLSLLELAVDMRMTPKRLARYCRVSEDLVKYRAQVNRITLGEGPSGQWQRAYPKRSGGAGVPGRGRQS